MPILNWFKSNNLNTTDAFYMKLYVHHRIMMIHTNYKFHYIMIIGYLVIAILTIFFINSRAITQVLPKTAWPNLTYVTSFKKCIFETSFMEFRPVVTKLWLSTDGQKSGWMGGKTDWRLNMDQTTSLRLWWGIISNEVMYWSTHSRKKTGSGVFNFLAHSRRLCITGSSSIR